MPTRSAEAKPGEELVIDVPQAGVIRDARRRRRRERSATALLSIAGLGALLFLLSAGNGARPARARAARPTWLAGAPLRRPLRLRLLASENGGPAAFVNVADGGVTPVRGLGLPRRPNASGSMLWPLVKLNGAALAVVTRRDCSSCAATETHLLIGPSGAARRVSQFRLAADQSSTPVLGSASASWVLTQPRGGHCTLSAEPRSRTAVGVPCGALVADTPTGSDTAAGLIISTGERMVLVDPRSGRVLARSPRNGHLDAVSRTELLASGPDGVAGAGGVAAPLTLIDLSTGARTRLRWPSILGDGYQVFPEPHSSIVALDFMDPAYAGTQASDVWLLNTRTGAFTHVPGFPILEYLKFSGLAWTTDRRLVVVAHGPRRTAVGIWRSGSRRLQVGSIPALAGYTELVAFTR